MKKLIIMAVSLLSLNANVFADTVKDNSPSMKSKANKVAFNKIVVNGDMDIVLTESDFVQVEIKGEQKTGKEVNYYLKKGVLYIDGSKGFGKTKPTVYIHVSHLQSIEVNGESIVSSNGRLASKTLKVVVNGEAKFDLKNYGEILFEAGEEIDLHFKKWKVN
jgi:Putative auto-transporter adhesin, head GIN domain